jgi:hypothetical protein
MHEVVLFSCLALALASRAGLSTHMNNKIKKQKQTKLFLVRLHCEWSVFESRLISTAPLVDQCDECIAHHNTYP